MLSERVPVTLDDLTIEVERLRSWAIAHTASRLVEAFYAAKPGDAELAALRDAFAFFLSEAQPTWDIRDHRGPVPATVTGLLRLPLDTALALVGEWLGTLTPASTAADAVLPAGPVRDAVNKELRKKRKG